MDNAGRQRLFGRWNDLCKRLEVKNDILIKKMFDDICSCYERSDRKAHDLGYLAYCLEAFDGDIVGVATDPDAIIMATWFHAVMKDPNKGNNVEMSAKIAGASLAKLGVANTAFFFHVTSLIKSTEISLLPGTMVTNDDERVLHDVCRSILGSPEAIFDAYESKYCEDHSWLDTRSYAIGRAASLKKLLEDPIYKTLPFSKRYEFQARHNMTRLIGALSVVDA